MDKPPVDSNLLGVDELGEILNKKTEIEAWLKKVKEVCLSRLERGLEVTGHKLVESRTKKIWADEEAAAKWLKRKMPADEVFKQKIISPTQAEKIIDITPRTLKLWEALVVKPEGDPTIAKESDKRPALITMVDEFDDLDEL